MRYIGQMRTFADDENKNEDEEWLEAEKEGEPQPLPDWRTIVLNSVSTDT